MAGGAMNKCYIATAGSYKDQEKVGGWVRNLGGHLESRITEDTTHVVVSEKGWKNQVAFVKEALDLNEDEDRDVKIVSYDWLEDSANERTKKREDPFLWERLDKASLERWKKARREEGRDDGGEEKMSHVGMIAEVFHESTDKFLDEKEKGRIDKKIKEDRKIRAEMEAEEKAEKRKLANTFQKGAKKARSELISQNHHIYADDTGFKYDILLTKVDRKHKRNERYALTLQIYESNAEPYTYAVNSQFAGTGHFPANNVLTAVGSGFPTAFRAFKKTFKEHTRVEWDERISHALERAKREKRERGRVTGLPQGTHTGMPLSESGFSGVGGGNAAKEEDFKTAPFLYLLPPYGTVGAVPEREKEKWAEPGQQGKDGGVGGRDRSVGGHERIGLWMSGANGAGPELAPKTPTMSESGTPQMPRTPKAVNPRTQQDQGDEFEGVMGGIVGGMSDGVPFQAQTFDELLGGDPLGDYPFEPQLSFDFNVDFGQPQDDITNDAEPKTSFNTAGGFGDSFEPGTQNIGETQVAERAQGELMEYVDHPLPATNLNSAEASDGMPGYDFGASIPGKRKASPTEGQAVEGKKPALGDEVADCFGEESYRFEPDTADGSLMFRVLAEEENAKANEQLQFEAQNAGGVREVEIEMD